MKKLLCVLVCMVFLSGVFAVTVSADTGPKPSVRITLEGLGDELCYGTLLSKVKSTGPQSAWDGDPRNAQHDQNEHFGGGLDYDVWKAFVDYEDADGYYFLQCAWRVDQTKQLNWTYYPPASFKVLLYFPQTNSFVVSEINDRYAFDSYYTVSVSADGTLSATRSYDFSWEIISLLVRIIITVLIELGLAVVFDYASKKQLLLLLGVNTITQVALNIILNAVNYTSGHQAFVSNYIVLELAIFAVEGILYYHFLDNSAKKKKRAFTLLYALVANTASFAAGFAIAKLLPGIF